MQENIYAISFDCPVSPDIEIKLSDNHDVSFVSWGIAWFSSINNTCQILKGDKQNKSDEIEHILNDCQKFKSTNFFYHFSHLSGDNGDFIKQPFVEQIERRDWIWMSIGEVGVSSDGHISNNVNHRSLSGFQELLECLKKDKQKSLSDVAWRNLWNYFKNNSIFSSNVIIVSDGQFVFVYRGNKSDRNVHLTKFTPPHKKTEVNTSCIKVDMNSGLDLHRAFTIVSTEPIDGDEKKMMEPGSAVVLRHSSVVWDKNLKEVETETIDELKSVNEKHLLSKQRAVNIRKEKYEKITTNIKAITHLPTGEPLSYRVLKYTHKTRYSYSKEVRKSTHKLRLSPVEDAIQEVDRASICFSEPTEPLLFADEFGNHTVHVTIEQPYKELEIFSEAIVKIYSFPPEDMSSSLRRAQIPILWLPSQRQLLLPYLLPPELPETQYWELYDYAMSFVERNDYQLLETLDDINQTIYKEFRYESGATKLTTTPYEVYVKRKGVCQDFANLFICLSRILNIPARYRMGYIFTGGDYQNKQQSDASHAWVEIYLPFLGWRGYDPTNGCLIEQDHIRVACGRNYLDSTPTLGTIYKGGGVETLHIDVKVEEVI